ncbi:MAG: DUF2920 family protein [Rhodospirillaceae bacterium]
MCVESVTIDRPHADIEHHVERRPLTYFVTLPEGGINADTGVILAIEGYGSRPNSEYTIKLRRYLASCHNCLCATVGYFGQAVKYQNTVLPGPEFFLNLNRHHGVSVTVPRNADVSDLIFHLAELLVEGGITELHPSCRVIRHCGGEYQSFGLLPAIDHLQVLHDILRRFPVRRSRLYAFGTSYGGYIALLLGKYAPGTFRMIVDNSGFARSNSDLYGDSLFRMQIGRLAATANEPMVWSQTPASPHFFDRHHAMIRDLLLEEHLRPTATRYYCTHYVGDTVAPFADKQCFVDRMRRHAAIELLAVDDAAIDGSLFKEPVHGLKASLRQLFDRAHAAYRAAGAEAAAPATTDFDQGSRYVFRCGGHSYVFRYSADQGLAVAVDRVTGFP